MVNERLVAYCGLYCPKCYKNVVSEAAENLKKTLKSTHIRGSKHEPNKEFKDILNDLISLHCPKICKDGGGNLNCKIRICCKSKNFNGCWECDKLEKCDFLTKQFLNNLKEIKRIGIHDFIKK